MSQEVLENMDRRPGNRTSSVPPKGNGNENKKSDSGTQKQYPRAPKRREGYSNRSQNEQGVRRPTPQKSRGMEDKRPRSRGTYREREDVSDQYQDYENVLNSRRKVNLNHLLNFSYNEPERHHGDGYTGRSNRSRVRNLRYNKEQFLQANCQFVVSQKGDYTIHNHNPDTLVDWDSVELIRVQSSETSSCPICLQSPVAAKMTRCGHIYCWACILHYLALGEKTWRKCPICYESIHDKDLRSVESKEVHQYKVGETITLRLMKRQKGKVYALPKSCKDKELGKFFSVKDSDLETRYMKILLASKEEIRKHVLSVERTALETQKVDAENSEMPFIDGALAMLKAREDANECFVSRKITTRKAAEPQSDIIPIPVKPLKTGKAAKVYKSAFSDEEDETAEKKTKERHTSEESLGSPKGSPHSEQGIGKSPVDISSLDTSNNSVPTDISTVSGSPENPCTSLPPGVMADTMPTEEAAEHLEMPSHPDVVSPSSKASGGADGAFYFYQAEDGQHIYLHALNARCLVKEYGALQHCPDTITATIVEMENIFMTEDLRKRLRYLGHLPLTCEFQVVELAIKPPIISKETLKFFSDDIEKRRRMRQRKHREERRRTKKIQDDEKKKMGITPDVTIVPSQFVPGVMSENRPSSPAAQSDDSNTSSMAYSPLDSGSYLNPLCPDFLSRTEADVETEGDQTTSVSFAQMLIAGKRQVPVWPKAAARGGDTASVIARGRTVSRGSEDSDPEDKVPVPEYHNSFGDAFQTALDNLHQLSPKGDVESNPPQATSGGKKKKKQQKLLLFSTSMARGGK